MRAIKPLIIALLVLAPGGSAFAAAAGADPFNFLFLDGNARAVGMGGAYTALASDANALLYNPAGLGNVTDNEVTFMHNLYFQSITQEYLGFASKTGWGVNINSLNFGDVPQTTLSNPDGTGLGTTGLKDLAVGLGYGCALGEHLSFGAGAKYINETIAGVSGQAFAGDVGVLMAVPSAERIKLGFSVQNIGPPVKFQGVNEDLPLNFRAGAAVNFSLLGQASTLSLQGMKERVGAVQYEAGLETVLAESLPLRVGYDSRNNAGPGVSVGVGWIFRTLALDYAFVPYGDLGSSHRFSVTWRWGAR